METRCSSRAVRIAWTILLSVTMLSSSACRRAQKPVIAVVPETTAQELWESEHAGAAHAAHQCGWTIYWNGPSSEDDLSRQIEIVNRSIARHVDGLVLAPDHAIALITPVRNAVAHGIPTVIVSSPLGIRPNRNVMFVLNDDRAAGIMAADRATRFLASGDEVAVLGVNPNILSSFQRADAFEAALLRKQPGVHVLLQRTISFRYPEAEENAIKMIQAHPRLRVLIGLNVVQTRAAYFALLKTGKRGRIRLIGFDQDLDLMLRLRRGEIDSIVAQDTGTMGAQAIAMIHAFRDGDHSDFTRVVEPVLVTRENIDSDPIQRLLEMNWSDQ